MEFFLDENLYETFLKAWGKSAEGVSKSEDIQIKRLIRCCQPSYDTPMDPKQIVKQLKAAAKQNKNIRIVLDREFWKNGNQRNQYDGWSYHIELVSKRHK